LARVADGFAVCATQRKRDLEVEQSRDWPRKLQTVMLYLELPEGLQGSKIPSKRFKANIL
jgi:hypothetical protein